MKLPKGAAWGSCWALDAGDLQALQEPDAGEATWAPGSADRKNHTVTSKQVPSSYRVTTVPSADKAGYPAGPGRRKIFKGARRVFTEQPKRVHVELRGSKLVTSTGVFVQIRIHAYRRHPLFPSFGAHSICILSIILVHCEGQDFYFFF